MDVAKLTATVAQNALPLTQNSNVGNNATNLSPKKIYAKIKKLTLPKERDEFLRWYQKYLENTIFGNQQQQQQQRQQHLTAGEKGKSTTKPSNNQQPQQQQQQQNDLQAPNTDDGDLAEADQNCSINNSSGNSGVGNGNELNSTYHQQITGDNSSSTTATLHLIKTENFNGAGLQYENNENPEETQTINIENIRDNNNTNIKNIPTSTTSDDIINSVTPLQAAKNLKSHEPVSLVVNSNSNNSEKSDLKCEKSEFTEKE